MATGVAVQLSFHHNFQVNFKMSVVW